MAEARDWIDRSGRRSLMNDLGRAAVLVIAIEEVLDELRDHDDPALDGHIAELEDCAPRPSPVSTRPRSASAKTE